MSSNTNTSSSNPSNINISPNNISGRCDLKCAYNFKYPVTNITARNDGSFIILSSDNTAEPVVTYNRQKYTVSNILITCPSIHTFNDAAAPAEILIVHTPVLGGADLIVGVPMVESGNSTNATDILTEVISTVSTNAPSSGESTNVNMNNFSLEEIVPKTRFFTYNSGDAPWIVYGLGEAIPMAQTTLTTLSQIISPFPLPTPGQTLFINPSGPNSTTEMGEGIYISCSPTGQSEEQTAVTYAKNNVSYDVLQFIQMILTSVIFKFLVACVFIAILFVAIKYLYSFLSYKHIQIYKPPKK